jgi:hypothetical protein
MPMLTVLGNPRRFCDGLTRREALSAGSLALLGPFFGLPRLARPEQGHACADRPGKAKSVILIFLHGGAPTQDMFDMKPQAPVEVRGEFRPIASNVPGIQICEHLPRTARWMHRCAIVRSVNHKAGCHNTLPTFTGYEVPISDISNANPNHPPSMGSVCEYLKRGPSDLPAYVCLPNYLAWGEAARRPGIYAGFLGQRYDPLLSECDPTLDPGLSGPYLREHCPVVRGAPRLPNSVLGDGITLDRLNTRRTLLQQIDDQLRGDDTHATIGSFGRTRQRAFTLLSSTTLKVAFNLDREETRLRDRYGAHLFGSSTLVARKLVEAGVRFVNVFWDSYGGRLGIPDFGWDTHEKNFILLRDHYLPRLDGTYSALLEDLEQRGFLSETLVLLISDFGRTPYVNKDAGRDHWSYCYSVVLAGAGIRGGTVYGASDAQAAFVKDNPVSTGDICATIYQCLGIDPDMLVRDRTGRPTPVTNGGRPIREILA